jgi:hypothetical protein
MTYSQALGLMAIASSNVWGAALLCSSRKPGPWFVAAIAFQVMWLIVAVAAWVWP